jgi:peptide/nickel transport system permease protein
MPVVLWTDALIYLLILTVVGFVLYARRYEHLRAPWRRVVRNRLAMAAAVVLAAFILVGLLDSVHFHPKSEGKAAGKQHYSGEVLSLLDWIAAPLRTRVEKTYSAPFASQLYARESVEQRDGSVVRIYPRLTYGARHLEDPASQRAADLARLVGRALVETLGILLLLLSALIVLLARRDKHALRATASALLRGERDVPWRVILGATMLVVAFTLVTARLGVNYHILGTDKVGQDVFYQAIKSIRTGLVIGTLTTLVMLPIAILLGIMAGYFRGRVDDAIQYIYTTLNSIPGVLLIAAAILLLQVHMARNEQAYESLAVRGDMRLLFLCIILGVTSWTGLCRLLRAETLKLREMEYVQAAESLGVGSFKIILRHLLPNVMHIVLITVVLDFSRLVLAEAVLSYINIGVDPTTISWGNMINSARLELAREPIVWWPLAAAFVFMFGLVLAANLFSDAVRDAFDPRLRGRQ